MTSNVEGCSPVLGTAPPTRALLFWQGPQDFQSRIYDGPARALVSPSSSSVGDVDTCFSKSLGSAGDGADFIENPSGDRMSDLRGQRHHR